MKKFFFIYCFVLINFFLFSDENLQQPLKTVTTNSQSLETPAANSQSKESKNLHEISQSQNGETLQESSQEEKLETKNVESSKSENQAQREAESGETAKKRPLKQDKEKIERLEIEYPDTKKENEETLKYGMEEDIISLIDNLLKNEDVRFVDEVYDLFYSTKNTAIREKILEYFTKLKDPCLEDYAISILEDPYDEKTSTVNAVFNYVQAVKTKAALKPVLALLESDDEKYFTPSLTTIGEIGGSEEAVFLSEYLKREDLTLAQKQNLVKVLGKIKAVETFESLVQMATDEDENSFVRMYSAEAIGSMQKEEAVGVLVKLYEDNDPKLRTYVIKGLSYFPENEEAKKTILQAIRDSHVAVRLEAIEVCKKNDFKEATPFIIYRLEKDKEDSIKKISYDALAFLNTKEGNEYLVKHITDKKVADNPKSRIARALLEYGNAGEKEIIALAEESLTDDRRKSLRYALGKEFAKYGRKSFSEICKKYLESKDSATQGTGLDIYAKGRYEDITPLVRKLVLDGAKNSKNNVNATKAEKILGSKDSAVLQAAKIKEENEKNKENKNSSKSKTPASISTKSNSSDSK
ncbi:HEAT repeat domain-containing protein [Treponema pectinovorum]|uniref:HEAT repeat domain-containing protein n=1 Tax=Treponema pectinovorum TaxID=164 RepID=UPI0011CB0428|nr:HEAT repeat domain-containing protein [Treponema pectinovorum]